MFKPTHVQGLVFESLKFGIPGVGFCVTGLFRGNQCNAGKGVRPQSRSSVLMQEGNIRSNFRPSRAKGMWGCVFRVLGPDSLFFGDSA